MVQIIEDVPTFGQQLASGLGRAAAAALQAGGEEFLRRKEVAALKNKGIDIGNDIRDPQTRSALLGYELSKGLVGQQNEANVPQRFRENKVQGNRNPEEAAQPGQIEPRLQPGQIEPRLQTAKSGQGNPPLSSGKSRKILDPTEIENQAYANYQEKLNRYGPMHANYDREKALLEEQNQSTERYQNTQREVANVGKAALAKAMPLGSSDQMESLIAKDAEEIADQNLSLGQRDEAIKNKVRDRVNMLHRIAKSLPPPRAGQRIKGALLGTGHAAEKHIQNMKLKVKPALDLGLHDDVREMFEGMGYEPEEIETYVSNLGESAQKGLADFAKVKRSLIKPRYGMRGEELESITPGSDEDKRFKGNLNQILSSDPNTNLILLRKGYEDKGVDWRSFLNAINDMQKNGEFKPNREQTLMLDTLDEPPLDNLGRILFTLGLRGR